jgi:outer membrane protein OmpA-like peptidoglycan-associated protein
MRALDNLQFRRSLTLLASASILAIGLSACSSDDDAGAGSPFTQALAKDYGELSVQAGTLPAGAAAESSFWDSLNPFSGGDSSSEMLAKAFTVKADMANAGTEPDLEEASGPARAALRTRVEKAVAAGKDQFPEQAARAQADYDCWVLYGTVPSAVPASQACRLALDSSLVRLESAGTPSLPPPSAQIEPAPAPVSTPTPQPAPAAKVSSDFTIYFDFDSWTLKAEQLKVMDAVIVGARTGGQTDITIVGHTDTSGSSEYNQKLSVRRANVVAEALVQMGARRGALHANGVGETDLAVQTGDGVKEAKNRRTVISLQP